MTWNNVKLIEVIKRRKGFITIDNETEYKLCRVQVHRKGVVLRELLKGFQINTKKQQVCKTGDFIVAEMDAKVGGYGFIPPELDGAIVSSHYFLFELDTFKIRPRFLEIISQLKILQEQIKAVGSTNYAAIRPANVLEWEIPLPPIEKQIEIERVFENAKQCVDNLNYHYHFQLTQLENLNQAILQEAVQGKLVAQVPNDEPASELLKRIKAEKAKSTKKEKPLPHIKPEEIPFEIPESWVWCRLGEICSKIGSGSTPKGSNYSEVGYPFFRSQNIYNHGLVYEDITFISEDVQKQMSGTIVFPNDILLNITGGSMGRCALVPDDFKEGNVSQHVCIIRPLQVDGNFFHKIVLSPYFQKFIFSSTTGAGREGLPKYNLEQFPIPLPPLSEQKRIVAEIEKQLAKTKQLKEHVLANQAATEQLLKALLHQAFEVESQEESSFQTSHPQK